MAETLQDAPWASGSALPDAPWAPEPAAKPAPASPGAPPAWSDAVTDIPAEIGRTAGKNWQAIREGLIPQSLGGGRDPSKDGALEGLGKTGSGLAGTMGLVLSPITGAARSLIGHPMAQVEHKIGEIINPEVAAKDDPQKMYETAAGDAETALMGIMPRGFKYTRPVPEVPPPPPQIAVPEAAPVAVSRENLGVRLLPADTSHAPVAIPKVDEATATLRQFGYPEDLIASTDAGVRAQTAAMLRQNYPEGPPGGAVASATSAADPLSARRSAGAAGIEGGPLADISPETLSMMKTMLQEQGFTPYTLEQRLAEMSSHEYLGELTPSTAVEMGGLARIPGAHRNELHTSIRQRAHEASERMGAEFDRAFGPNENRAQLQRVMKIDRDEKSHPFWQRFRETEIPPTQEIETLLPRLEAAGALQAANKALAIEGLPSSLGFEKMGGRYVPENPLITTGGAPPPMVRTPTASAFQAAKEHLDDLIERSMAAPGGENEARRFTALKNALVNAIDNHPSVDVANMWKSARDVYAEPTSIMKAMKLGERVLTGNIHAEELPFMTASFSPAEMKAFNIGIRGRLEDLAGRPGKTDNAVINTVLAPSNQSKIRWAIGDEKAGALIAAIEHEQRIHHAPTRLIYNSVTAEASNAMKRWQPSEGLFESVTLKDISHPIRSGVKAGVRAGAEYVFSKRADRKAAEFAKLREEAARIFTLQGAERDAVLRHLLEVPPEISGHKRGGRVVRRAAGGRVVASNVNGSPTEAQKKAGNYAKDHVRVHGLDITIENAKGSKRTGIDKGGKPWSVTMPAHYGYIKGTVGKDKDHVDVYLGPHRKAPHVFVVDQKNTDTGAFDEHKTFIGFASKPQVVKCYKAAFSDGRASERLGTIHEMSVGAFKLWLNGGDTTKPIAAEAERKKLPHMAVGYVTHSRIRDESCGACFMFMSEQEGGPGCTLVKDPIVAAGWCRRFSAAKEKAA